jgi:hypothetical protein
MLGLTFLCGPKKTAVTLPRRGFRTLLRNPSNPSLTSHPTIQLYVVQLLKSSLNNQQKTGNDMRRDIRRKETDSIIAANAETNNDCIACVVLQCVSANKWLLPQQYPGLSERQATFMR